MIARAGSPSVKRYSTAIARSGEYAARNGRSGSWGRAALGAWETPATDGSAQPRSAPCRPGATTWSTISRVWSSTAIAQATRKAATEFAEKSAATRIVRKQVMGVLLDRLTG